MKKSNLITIKNNFKTINKPNHMSDKCVASQLRDAGTILQDPSLITSMILEQFACTYLFSVFISCHVMQIYLKTDYTRCYHRPLLYSMMIFLMIIKTLRPSYFFFVLLLCCLLSFCFVLFCFMLVFVIACSGTPLTTTSQGAYHETIKSV